MPRLTKADAALRDVILGRAPLKTKRQALAMMATPSETFLSELLSSASVHPKLKIDVSERLASIRSRKQRVTPLDEAAKRAEIDHWLAEAAVEQGVSLDAKPTPMPQIPTAIKSEGPNSISESTVRQETEPQNPADCVPGDGPQNVSPQNGQETEIVPSAGAKRTELLQRGRALSERILIQRKRCELALQNKEERQRLDRLHAEWAQFEKEATAAGIDLRAEFDKLDLIRPFRVKVDLWRQRGMLLSMHELTMQMMADLPRQSRQEETPDGMWAGVPKGI